MTSEEIDQLPAGPELDVLVAQKVMGFEIMRSALQTRDGFPTYRHRHPERDWDWMEMAVPQFSTEIAAAWLLVEKLKEIDRAMAVCDRSYGSIKIEGDRPWEAGFINGQKLAHDPGQFVQAFGPTAPLAICRAALKAVMGAKQ